LQKSRAAEKLRSATNADFVRLVFMAIFSDTVSDFRVGQIMPVMRTASNWQK
jgi:hypothetical protein